jgi:hypothetical protein
MRCERASKKKKEKKRKEKEEGAVALPLLPPTCASAFPRGEETRGAGGKKISRARTRAGPPLRYFVAALAWAWRCQKDL